MGIFDIFKSGKSGRSSGAPTPLPIAVPSPQELAGLQPQEQRLLILERKLDSVIVYLTEIKAEIQTLQNYQETTRAKADANESYYNSLDSRVSYLESYRQG
ncbi:Uncharacterised protein [uncultured archaeon]|nr:Uncharacterised protein [uncultured archaeon]